MRIGFYIDYIVPETTGGGSVFQSSIINEIKKYKSHHQIYVFYKSNHNIFGDIEGITFINLNNFINSSIVRVKKDLKYRIRKLLKKQKKQIHFAPESMLDDILKKYNIDLIYFYCVQYEKVSIPYIITVWDLAHCEHPYFPEVSITQWTFDARTKFYSSVLPKAARVVVGNSEGKRQICKYYNVNEDVVKTIPMITPSDVYTLEGDNSMLDKLNLEKNKFLYYPAQFWSHKNHIRLLKELKNLKDNKINLKLVFSGSDQGNQKYIESKTKELGLDNDVIFAGFLKREEVIALYKNAYALTYASYFGPDNIPPLEAMALNCPVICSEYKGSHEQLKDCALYFDGATGENFYESIIKLNNDNFKSQLIQKANKLALTYSTGNYVKKMFKIIDDFECYRECWE